MVSEITTRVRKAGCLHTLVLLSAFLCAAGNVWAAEPPLAKLSNGETVSARDFNEYLARRVDLKPLARNFWGAENALKEMLTTRVLVLEGERTKEPYRASGEPARFDDAYGLAVYRKLVRTCPASVDAATARKFFDEHPETFTVPPSARLARVMLPVAETVDGVSAMAWLMDRATDVAKGVMPFEQVATRATKAYKLEVQGDLGWVNIEGDAPVMRALAGAKSGEMLGPMREGDFGYLILVGEKREARPLKWSEVEKSAANRQVVYCRQQASKELTDKLFKQYGVTIDNAAIKALFDVRQRPAASKASSSSTVAK